jgi:hypothetical protein
MDFSLLALFVLAGVGATILAASETVGKGPKNPRGIAFAATFILGLLLMQPWSTFTSTEWQEFAAVTLIMAVWVAFGSVAGGELGRRLSKWRR